MAARRTIPTCAICEDDESGEAQVATLCGHIFHEACIERWDVTQTRHSQYSKCPMCQHHLHRILPDPRGRQRPLKFYVPLYSLAEPPPDPAIPRLNAVVRTQVEKIVSLQLSCQTLSDEKKTLNDSLRLEQSKSVQQAAAADENMMKVAVQWSEAQAKFAQTEEQLRETRCELTIKAFELQDASENVLKLTAEGEKLRQTNAQTEHELQELSSTNKTLVEQNALLQDKVIFRSHTTVYLHSCFSFVIEQGKNETAALGKLQETHAHLGIETLKLRSTVQNLGERDILAKDENRCKAAVIQQLQESSVKIELELKELKSTIKRLNEREEMSKEDIEYQSGKLKELLEQNRILEERLTIFKQRENKLMNATIQKLEQNHALLVLNLKNSACPDRSQSFEARNSQSKKVQESCDSNKKRRVLRSGKGLDA